MVDIYKTPTAIPGLYRRSPAILFSAIAVSCAAYGILFVIVIRAGLHLLERIRNGNIQHAQAIENAWTGVIPTVSFALIVMSMPNLCGIMHRGIVSESGMAILAIWVAIVGALAALAGTLRASARLGGLTSALLLLIIFLGSSFLPVNLWLS